MNRTIDFLKLRFIFLIVSVVVILAGILGTYAQGGFNLGVDFQAGLRQQVQIDPDVTRATLQDVRSAVGGIEGSAVQSVGSEAEQRYSIRVIDPGEDPAFTATIQNDLVDTLRAAFGDNAVVEEESALVGPQFSANLAQQAFWLTTVAFVLILAYVWVRFRLAYAIGSIIPIIHDVAVLLGVIGAFQLEVSTATVAAVLTVVGYSLNDTIVIFDRIRENETIMRGASFAHIINSSITQSLTRTLITSVTTLLAVLAIFIFATGTIQTFALALMVGVVVGTYSSVFVASPALLALRGRVGDKKGAKVPSGGVARKPAPAGAITEGDDAGKSQVVVDAEEAAAIKEEIKQQRRTAAAGKSAAPRAKRKKKK